jgi:hypothetical protein
MKKSNNMFSVRKKISNDVGSCHPYPKGERDNGSKWSMGVSPGLLGRLPAYVSFFTQSFFRLGVC